ncbi:hypothetical protein Y032_0126g1312 [Ancylostoma ceylanicum]|uniref:Uncharacterized protein n=1 Tax=Ancylostoma ceylanicum TaxID=53326 RepID=A0A016T7J1_9BILA|nr:hypothetical protein Y032_0126g1312 [Ancylostoma ceylanicum]
MLNNRQVGISVQGRMIGQFCGGVAISCCSYRNVPITVASVSFGFVAIWIPSNTVKSSPRSGCRLNERLQAIDK